MNTFKPRFVSSAGIPCPTSLASVACQVFALGERLTSQDPTVGLAAVTREHYPFALTQSWGAKGNTGWRGHGAAGDPPTPPTLSVLGHETASLTLALLIKTNAMKARKLVVNEPAVVHRQFPDWPMGPGSSPATAKPFLLALTGVGQ